MKVSATFQGKIYSCVSKHLYTVFFFFFFFFFFVKIITIPQYDKHVNREFIFMKVECFMFESCSTTFVW